MPIADLPYRIERLAKEGQYAYLCRSASRAKLRVLRNVTLCNGPSLWDSVKSSEEPYAFYVTLRLFATRTMVEDYLNGPEVTSYCSASGAPRPVLTDGDLVITEDTYLTEAATVITGQEYRQMLQSRDSHLSLDDLEELVCQIRGIDNIESLAGPKRGRRKKVVATLALEESQPSGVAAHSSDEEEAKRDKLPGGGGEAAQKPKKRTARSTFREQFVTIQNTPSRVIDVSSYGDTMQHQRGRLLDRVKHVDRISKCTVLPDLFPVVSDNVAGFERAMTALGPRYLHRVAEFKCLRAASVSKA